MDGNGHDPEPAVATPGTSDPGPPARRRRTDTLSTYRHLRLSMVLLLVMLLIAVGEAAVVAPAKELCFEGSISAYYFTSARAVFVGVLCALGTCLIVYRGNTDHEDVALNVSGALAFVVAFVPTSTPRTDGVFCSASNVPRFDQLDLAIDNNMRAYFAVAALALGTAFALSRGRRTSTTLRVGQVILAVAWIVGVATFWRWPEGFRDNAHSTAAVLTFVGILAVVLFNAARIKRPELVSATPPTRAVSPRPGAAGGVPGWARIGHEAAGWSYVGIAVVMALSFAIAGYLHVTLEDWRHGLLVIESLLLVEFLAFWLVQTSELWDDREEPPAAAPPAGDTPVVEQADPDPQPESAPPLTV